MLSKTYISYLDKNFEFQTNDMELLNNFKNEYSQYFKFDNSSTTPSNIKFKVLKDQKSYSQYYSLVRKNRHSTNNNTYINIRRNNIIIIDKSKKEVFLVYDLYSDDKLQHVEEISCGLFGKMLENDGFLFIHASCISKNGNGILITGDKHVGKTSLMLKLIQNGYDFVANSHIGIKNNLCIGIPTRIGIRPVVFENGTIEKKYVSHLKKTNDYIKNFVEPSDDLDSSSKFNITVKDINNIFQTNTISHTNIKLFIDLHYSAFLKQTKITKMNNEEIVQAFLSNKRDSIYKPVSYIDNLFDNKSNNNSLQYIKQFHFNGYKLFQNEISDQSITHLIHNNIIY